ncbi:sulfotransferase domain-containing protein [Vibrio astriarenae]
MIELILHPGHSKCGSTTIQDFIYENRLTLKKRGIFIPDSEFNFPGDKAYNINRTHTPRDYFEKVLRGETDLSAVEAKLASFLADAEKKGCRKVIITAENLVNGIGSQKTKSLHRLFSSHFHKVNIVYYIRNQRSLLTSAWQQWGHKKGESLEQYVDKALKSKFGDYHFVVQQLNKSYPKATVKVCPLDKAHLVKGNLVVDFCVRAGLNSKGLKLEQYVSNAGLSEALCESLSKIHKIYESPHSQKVKNAILALCPNSHTLVSRRYVSILPANVENKIIERYGESNKALEEMYFDKNSLFPSEKPFVLDRSEGELLLLKQRVDKLEDLVAIQMDMIMTLSGKL